MRVRAKGRLLHGFFGDYVATIALGFDSEVEAKAALAKLGEGWKAGVKSASALVWSGNGDALKGLKARLKAAPFDLAIEPCNWRHCVKQCADAEIDSLAHSIDCGPVFTLALEVDDPPLF